MDNGNSTARILLWDLELSPLTIRSWKAWEATALEILEEQRILAVSWKWLGEAETHVLALPDFPETYEADPLDDTSLVKVLHGLLSETDVSVYHNGDKFDRRHFNSRAIKAGLPPIRPHATVDTLKVARKHLAAPKNTLDALGEYLGVGRKLDNGGYGLWARVMRGNDVEAWSLMREYARQDVVLLEQIYLKLRPLVDNHPAVLAVDDKFGFNDADVYYNCPACGSENVHREGARRTRTMLHRRLRCVDCGSWSTGVSKRIKAEEIGTDDEEIEETSDA